MKVRQDQRRQHQGSETEMYRVMRPAGRNNNPLIVEFIFTAEPLNPWRCDGCATRRQRRKAKTLYAGVIPDGCECCRKCGLDFFR